MAKQELVEKEISRKVAVGLIKGIVDEGQFFSVLFIKRTTGEERFMVCRGGVKKYVKGVGLAFEPSAKKLVGVWETANKEGAKEADAYRFISEEGIKEVNYGGVKYKVV